jgi:hypothetical protein
MPNFFSFRRARAGVTWLTLGLGAAAGAHAAWADLKEGQDAKTATQEVGLPLIQTRGRGGVLETWTYDEGGYILFENGRVRYWQAPRALRIERAVNPPAAGRPSVQ